MPAQRSTHGAATSLIAISAATALNPKGAVVGDVVRLRADPRSAEGTAWVAQQFEPMGYCGQIAAELLGAVEGVEHFAGVELASEQLVAPVGGDIAGHQLAEPPGNWSVPNGLAELSPRPLIDGHPSYAIARH